ncbi:hypothetical protein [Rhodoferax koreensis]|uniref:hypothetical protein n=1 Tax=Rhodoferax koreensis TaxID=1842727 RepID=UPI0012FF89E5|nr:hypothetical protein [Rhodoferax koreense]
MNKRRTNVQNNPLPKDHRDAVAEARTRRDRIGELIRINRDSSDRSVESKEAREAQLLAELEEADAIVATAQHDSYNEQNPVKDRPEPKPNVPDYVGLTASGKVKA